MMNKEMENGGNGPSKPLKDPSRKLIWWLAGMVVLGFIGLMTAKPVYRHFKKTRALRLVEESNSLIQSNRWDAIGKNVQLALRLAPQEPTVLRLTARYCAHFGVIDGLNYWQLLLATSTGTRQDKLDYVRHAQRVGRLDLAGKELAGLIQKDPMDREALMLGLQVVQQRGDSDGVLRFGRVLISSFPLDPEAAWLAGSAYVSSVDPAIRREGRGLLWNLAVGSSKHKDQAVRRLAVDEEINQGEIDALLKTFDPKAPEATLETRLLNIHLRLRRFPAQRENLLREAIRLTPPKAPSKDRAVLAQWLLDHREAARILEILPIDDVRKDPLLLQFHLQAAAELRRWQEVNAILEDPDLPLEPIILHCFRGIADKIGGRGDHATAHFNNAISAAKKQPDQLMVVAQFAELSGAIASAIDAKEHLLYFPQIAAATARDIVRLAQQLDDLTPSLAALKRLTQFMPDDPILLNELTYVQLVMNTRDPEIEARAKKLFDARPDFLPNRLLWAFWNLRANRPTEALALLKDQKVDWTSQPPRTQAVYVAVLGANNQRDGARRIARRIQLKQLKPQERNLVEPWL